jgi:hypothetical protein
MVPGSGNRDTVPAMLQPGEFVIRKSSVKRLGAGNLAAMNENKYEAGGVVKQSKHLYGSLPPRGMTKATANMTLEEAIASGKLSRQQLSKGYGKEAIDQVLGTAASANASKERSKTRKRKSSKIPTDDALKSKYPGGVFRTIPGAIGGFFLTPESGTDSPYVLSAPYPFDLNGQKAAIAPGSTISNFVPYRTDIKKNAALNKIIDSSARGGLRLGVKKALPKVNAFLDMPQINFDENTLNDAANAIAQDKQVYSTVGGYLFEGIIQGITGSKLLGGRESFDFPNVANNKAKLAAMFTTDISSLTPLIKADAKRSKTSKTNKSIIDKLRQDIQKNNLDGVMRLASGGIAKAPLIDDIVNASGTMMPRPSSAIASLIRAGGGAIDIDRTIKRTIGDKAYGMAKTSGQQSAALEKYFRDPQARLKDVTSAPLTAFGKELQAAIKSGQLQPGKLSILSKSQRVPGVAEYLSQLFGIPLANMIFTQGGSKQPAMDALRTKGPRSTRVARFATGGNVGTDTVPALLTPGEFVINRASAQKIGYSSLHRMNKVGKYAKGGVVGVQKFAAGGATLPMGAPGSLPNMTAATQSVARFVDTTDRISDAQDDQRRSIGEVINSNKFFAASTISSLAQGFLPAVDESSGVILKLTHGMLGLTTTLASVGFALEAFKIQLDKQNLSSIFDLLSGKGGKFANRAGTYARLGAEQIPGLAKFGPEIATVTRGLAKFAGSLAGVTLAVYSINTIFKALFDQTAKLNKAIELGDVEGARKAARGQTNLEGANVGTSAGAIIGLIVGGPIGAAIGAGVGRVFANLPIASYLTDAVSELFGGRNRASAIALADAQANASKTTKAFEQRTKDSAQIMKDLETGSISATEALKRLAASGAAQMAAQSAAYDRAIAAQENSRSGTLSGFGRGALRVGTLGIAGLLGVESGAGRNERIDREIADTSKQRRAFRNQNLESMRGNISQAMRENIYRGRSESDVYTTISNATRGPDGSRQILTPTELKQQRDNLKAQQAAAEKSGNKQQAETIGLDIAQIDDEINFLEQSFKNLSTEIELARKRFAAINLGFRTVSATSEAAALRLNNFVANLEVGAVPAQQAVATLEASLTKAGQAISENEVNSALDEVSGVFKQFGASEAEITKFRENIGAAATVQRNFPTIFENIKRNLQSQDLRGMEANSIADVFKKEVAAQLDASGVGEDVRNRILDSMGAIDQDIIDAIDRGDYDKLGETLEGVSQEASKVMQEIVDNYAKIHQQLIELTKRRIEAERNYIEAQKEALSIQMEARELQGKYGGKAVTNAERQANVIARANAGAERMRLSNLQGGGVDQLRRRNDEIRQQFAGIEGKRTVEGGMAGTQGVVDDAIQADLEKASKDQISTIRELIKIQEDELKLIQEKNKLEKDSLDALIAGDVDKFFEQQAAVGATAAIATGNETLMNQFGAKALGAAYTDIQRQQEAGVQELYGVRLAGAGGLTERAAGASLAARGVTDPRAAQLTARTTAEEERINANIRGLSNELADAGQVQADLAAMKLRTAKINVEQAEIKLAGGETLKLGGPSTPATSGGAGGTGGAATTNAAATAAAGTAGRVAGGGGAGGVGGTGGTGGRVAAGVAGGVSAATVAAAGEPVNRDIFGSIRRGTGLAATGYAVGPSAVNAVGGAAGRFRAGMDVAKIGMSSGGLSRVGKLGYGVQNTTTAIRNGAASFGIGRGLEQAGFAAQAGETAPARLGRFSVKAQNFAQNLPANTAQQYNYLQSGRSLQRQGLTPSTRAGKAGALIEKGVQGFQNFRTGLSRTTAPTFGSKAMALGQRVGAIGNRLSPLASGASSLAQRGINAVGGRGLVSGASNLVKDFGFGRGLVGSGMEDEAFTLAQKAGVGAQRLGNKVGTGVRAASIQAQRLGLRAPSAISKLGGSLATQGRAVGIQAQRLGLRALPMAQRGLSAAGTAGGNLLKGFNVGRSGLANAGGMFGQQAAKTAGSTLAGRAGLLGGQTLAKVAGSGVGKFAGSLLTKGGGLGLGTAISGVTNLAEFAYDPSAYNAKMQGKSDAGLARAQTRDTAGFAYDSAAGALEGFVDPVGKLVEAGYVMKDFTKDAMAASQAAAKTEKMKAATVDATGLNVQERTWAKEQAMRENQLAAAQAKGDQTGVATAQKELKDLEARRIQERTANDWLPSMLSGAGTDTQEYKQYVEQQKAAQQAQTEAAAQQEAQAKATAEAVATPMSNIPPASLVTPEKANELLNQSGVQAMQVSQTQPGRASQQTLSGGTLTNQTAGTTTPIQASGGIDPEIVNKLMATLDKFNVDLSANIDKLANTNLSIKLDATNINVNLSGGDFLAKLTKDVQQAVLTEVSNKLQNASIGNDGKLKLSSGSLPGSPSAPI